MNMYFTLDSTEAISFTTYKCKTSYDNIQMIKNASVSNDMRVCTAMIRNALTSI